MTKLNKDELNHILDSEGDESGMVVVPEQQGDENERALRLQAETEARDLSQKLKVYQQQFSEYVDQKASIEKELANKMSSLTERMASGFEGSMDANFIQELVKLSSSLKEEILECAMEAAQ